MSGSTNVVRSARVEQQRLAFAAAHMATFAGTIEPLHGHNYAVTIEAEGDLAVEGWVVDFGVLKRSGRALCERLDHRFLLQGASTLLGMNLMDGAWEVWFADKHYRIPAEDVLSLPVSNTTAEQIAEWFWAEMVRSLRGEGISSVKRLSIGIEEAPGQAGWFGADVDGRQRAGGAEWQSSTKSRGAKPTSRSTGRRR